MDIDEIVQALADHAACRNETDVFFSKDKVDILLALATCRTCPVLVECREYAPITDRKGIFGVLAGMTEKQRRGNERKRRSRDLAA